jgi:hypothetical protein
MSISLLKSDLFSLNSCISWIPSRYSDFVSVKTDILCFGKSEIFSINPFIHDINKNHKHHLHIIPYHIIAYHISYLIIYHTTLYHLQDKCQLYLFSKMYILHWHKTIQQFTIQCDNPQDWQKKLNWLKGNISVGKDYLKYGSCKIFLVFHTCVFLTCSTSYWIYDSHMDPWNVYVYICICMCIYIYMCVCVNVCMYVHKQVCIYVCVVCVYIYIYIYTYTCMYSFTIWNFKNISINFSTLFPVCENSAVSKTKSLSLTLYFHLLQALRSVKSVKSVHIVLLLF